MPTTTTRRRKTTTPPKRARSRSRRRTTRRQARSRGGTPRLPSWAELSWRATGAARATPSIEQVSTARFAGLLFLVVLLVGGYVGHVHATQDLLVRVQQERQENQRLHLKHNRLKGAFDRATGPSVVYERAAALGLEEGLPYGPTLAIDD